MTIDGVEVEQPFPDAFCEPDVERGLQVVEQREVTMAVQFAQDQLSPLQQIRITGGQDVPFRALGVDLYDVDRRDTEFRKERAGVAHLNGLAWGRIGARVMRAESALIRSIIGIE